MRKKIKRAQRRSRNLVKMEARAKKQTGSAIKALMGLQAKTARVIRDGVEQDIPIETVIRPGRISDRYEPSTGTSDSQ